MQRLSSEPLRISSRSLNRFRRLLDDFLKTGEAIGQRSGAGLQDQGRFDLYMSRCGTTGICTKPGRVATRSVRDFLPHHEPMITWGSRATTSSTVITRSLDVPRFLRSGEDIDAARDFDELGDPSGPGDIPRGFGLRLKLNAPQAR